MRQSCARAQRRGAAAVLVLGVLLGACGGDDEALETVNETPPAVLTATVAPPAPTERATDEGPAPVQATEASEAPVAPATEPPTEAPATEAPVETPPPVASGTVLAVGAGEQLAGVAVLTPAEDAIAALTSIFGPPASDTGWIIGCPLDSPENLNERVLTWGSLDALFYLEEGGERFVGWRYRYDAGAGGGLPGGPAVAQVQLPGGALLGSPIDDVAAASGAPAIDDALTGARIIQGPDYVIVADGGPGTIASSVHVPVLRACE
jgi:hypothetical protein